MVLKVKIYETNMLINGKPTTILLSDKDDMQLLNIRFPKLKIKGKPKLQVTSRFRTYEGMLALETIRIQKLIDDKRVTYEE